MNQTKTRLDKAIEEYLKSNNWVPKAEVERLQTQLTEKSKSYAKLTADLIHRIEGALETLKELKWYISPSLKGLQLLEKLRLQLTGEPQK